MSNLRILIDKDDVLYKLVDTWYNAHNVMYGHIHTLTGDEWEDGQRCKDNNCPADIFGYFKDDAVWLDGFPYPESQRITATWQKQGHELAIVTKSANPVAAKASWDWISKNYPTIENIIMTTAPKSWIQADVLIDDSPLNLVDFQGVSILFDQKWNRKNKTLPRAHDWLEVEKMVQYIQKRITYYRLVLPDLAWAYKHIQQELLIT